MYTLKCNKCNHESKTYTLSETTRFLWVCSDCGSTDIAPLIRAKCIKGFAIEKCDDDGFTIENDYIVVEEESIWEINQDDYRFVGGEVRLTNDELGWLEIWEDTLKEHFILIS